MSLNEKKFTALLVKIRDASRRTVIPSIYDLFNYIEREAPNNSEFLRYEDERRKKWGDWGESRMLGDWDMPLDENDRKSLAYHLYRGVVECGDAGNGTLHWMYHQDFELNFLYFQRDFFDVFVHAMEDVYNAQEVAASPIDKGASMPNGIRLFVSHSAKDAALAKALVDCIDACLEVPDKAIRCTSVPGYKLAPGDVSDAVLRDNIEQCSVVIGLLTEESLRSGYVIMELGAAWGLSKTTCALLAPGVEFNRVPGPLARTHAVMIDKDHDMASVMDAIADKTGWPLRNRAKSTAAVNAFLDAVRVYVAKKDP